MIGPAEELRTEIDERERELAQREALDGPFDDVLDAAMDLSDAEVVLACSTLLGQIAARRCQSDADTNAVLDLLRDEIEEAVHGERDLDEQFGLDEGQDAAGPQVPPSGEGDTSDQEGEDEADQESVEQLDSMICFTRMMVLLQEEEMHVGLAALVAVTAEYLSLGAASQERALDGVDEMAEQIKAAIKDRAAQRRPSASQIRH